MARTATVDSLTFSLDGKAIASFLKTDKKIVGIAFKKELIATDNPANTIPFDPNNPNHFLEQSIELKILFMLMVENNLQWKEHPTLKYATRRNTPKTPVPRYFAGMEHYELVYFERFALEKVLFYKIHMMIGKGVLPIDTDPYLAANEPHISNLLLTKVFTDYADPIKKYMTLKLEPNPPIVLLRGAVQGRSARPSTLEAIAYEVGTACPPDWYNEINPYQIP